ncbi:MAG: tetratricopeptide repeat protein, partial [Chloroflexi bacterium]|nr:tetratricopeptide repeat protein [Chloroflexota bacterium]
LEGIGSAEISSKSASPAVLLLLLEKQVAAEVISDSLLSLPEIPADVPLEAASLWFQAVAELWPAGKIEQTQNMLRLALRKAPAFTQARLDYIRLLYEQRQSERALHELALAAQYDPVAALAAVEAQNRLRPHDRGLLRLYVRLQIGQGQLRSAEASVRWALRSDPQDPELLWLLEEVQEREVTLQERITRYLGYIRKYVEPVQGFATADQLLQRVIVQDPGNQESRLEASLLCLRHGQIFQGMDRLDQAVRRFGDPAIVELRHRWDGGALEAGIALGLLGDDQGGAVGFFRRALEAHHTPGDPLQPESGKRQPQTTTLTWPAAAWGTLALFLIFQGRFRSARELMRYPVMAGFLRNLRQLIADERFLQLYGYPQQQLHNLVYFLRNEGEFCLADGIWRRWVFHRSGEAGAAASPELLLGALATSTTLPAIHALAALYLEAGDLAGAVAQLQRALAAEPSTGWQVGTRLLLAQVELNMGDILAAQAHLEMLPARGHGIPRALSCWAWLALARGDEAAASAWLERAALLDPAERYIPPPAHRG